MTRKEAVLAAIRRQPSPRRAVALLSGELWSLRSQGVGLEQALSLPAERFAATLAVVNNRVGSDIIWTASGYHNLVVRALGGRVAFPPDAIVAAAAPLATRPCGAELSLEADPGLAVLLATTRHLAEHLGSTTLIGASQWSPFSLAGVLVGRKRLAYLLATDKPEAKAVLAFAAEVCAVFLERFVEAGAELVSLTDQDVPGGSLPLPQFEEFVLPQLATVTERLRQRGALVCLHVGGDCTDRLDLLSQLGLSFISLDQTVDLAKAWAILKDRLAVAGNLDPVGILREATPAAVAAVCQRCLEKVGHCPGYIVMPGGDLPADVPLANVQAMTVQAEASAMCQGLGGTELAYGA